jgi:hypothetical protein
VIQWLCGVYLEFFTIFLFFNIVIHNSMSQTCLGGGGGGLQVFAVF